MLAAACHAWDARCSRVRRRGPPSLLRHEWRWFAVSDERFPLKWSGETAVVSASGEIDITNAEPFRDVMLTALNAGAAGLVVDMTSATFLDSAGVTALVRAARRSAAADATLRLAVAAPPVLRVLNLVGIDRLIGVYPSLADAMASLPDQTGRGLPA
jgi:anti-sigma B factor antagonist